MSHEQLRIVSDVSVYKRTCIEELETKFNTKKARYLDDPSLESVPTTMLATENSSNSQYSLSLWKKNGGHESMFWFYTNFWTKCCCEVIFQGLKSKQCSLSGGKSLAAERLGLLDNTSFSNRERWVVGERISMGCFVHFAAGKGFSERINSRSYVVFEAQTPKPVMRLLAT